MVAGASGRAELAAVVLPAAFTVTWALPAASRDETGLWLVRALLVAAGSWAGVAALAHGTSAARRRWSAGGGGGR